MTKKKNISISFNNKVVLITGSSRGIGKKISDNFETLGAKIIKLNSSHYDFKNDEDLKKLKLFISKQKKIDILINNAAINYSENNLNFSEEKFDHLFKVNLKAPFLITSEVSKIMKKNKYGKIINISSIASIRVREGKTAYTSSKFAIEGFTKALAVELSKFNILVNSVAPGFIDTDMTRTMLSKNEIKKLSNQVPLKRLGNTDDIANAVIFLASNMNNFINGHSLVVDGGFVSSINV
tara:strand:+ start:1507 stop:2220 length:714 start_codon:yes stop_codon:yes gene_type:complete